MAATKVVIVGSTSITASTPAGTVGAVTVTVTNPLAQSGSLANGFHHSAHNHLCSGHRSTPQTPQTSVAVTFTAAQ